MKSTLAMFLMLFAAACGTDAPSTVGIGVNLNTASSRVLIYFAGGGACWSELTCETQWNLAATLPAGCTACSTDLSAFYGFTAQSLPNSRGALISCKTDTVITSFYGISGAQFTAGLQEDITNQIAPHANLKVFTVQQFIGKMVTDDSTWSSVLP